MFYKINVIALFAVFLSTPAFAGGMEEICREIAKPSKPPTWGAEYVEGVDVKGKRVAPADLNSSHILPNPIVIPVEIDLIKRFGLALPADINMTPEVFRINIFDNGQVTYNDQDIAPKIKKACDEYHEENFVETPQAHGQSEANTLPSDDTIEGQYPPLNE